MANLKFASAIVSFKSNPTPIPANSLNICSLMNETTEIRHKDVRWESKGWGGEGGGRQRKPKHLAAKPTRSCTVKSSEAILKREKWQRSQMGRCDEPKENEVINKKVRLDHA